MTNPDNVGGLLPCPFCGGEAQLSDGECGIRGMPMNWRNPRCTRCGCDLGYCHHIEAVERWNRRAELCRAAPAGGDSRPDADWYRRNIEREPDDIGAGVPSLASPKGWVMVPAEPTAEMLRAGSIVEPPDSQWGQNYIEKAGARQCWDLMLRAAPKDSAPAGSGEVEDENIANIESYAGVLERMARCNPRTADDFNLSQSARHIRDYAALLRKLQQGAE